MPASAVAQHAGGHDLARRPATAPAPAPSWPGPGRSSRATGPRSSPGCRMPATQASVTANTRPIWPKETPPSKAADHEQGQGGRQQDQHAQQARRQFSQHQFAVGQVGQAGAGPGSAGLSPGRPRWRPTTPRRRSPRPPGAGRGTETAPRRIGPGRPDRGPTASRSAPARRCSSTATGPRRRPPGRRRSSPAEGQRPLSRLKTGPSSKRFFPPIEQGSGRFHPYHTITGRD